MTPVMNKFLETVKSSDLFTDMGSNSRGIYQPHKDVMAFSEVVFRREKYASDHKLLHEELDKVIEFSLNRPMIGEHGAFLRKLGYLIKQSNISEWEPEFFAKLREHNGAMRPTDEQFNEQYGHVHDFAKAPTPQCEPQEVPAQQAATMPSPMPTQTLPQSQPKLQEHPTPPGSIKPQAQDTTRVRTPSLAMAHLIPAHTPVTTSSLPSPDSPAVQIAMSPPHLNHAQYYAALQKLNSNHMSTPKKAAKRKRTSPPPTPQSAKSQKLNGSNSPSKRVDYSQYHAAVTSTPQPQHSTMQHQTPSPVPMTRFQSTAPMSQVQSPALMMPQVKLRMLSNEEILNEIPPYSDPYQHNGAWWIAAKYWINEEITHINLSVIGVQVIGNGNVITRIGRILPIGQLAKVSLLSSTAKHHLCPPWLIQNFRQGATTKQQPAQQIKPYYTQAQKVNMQQQKRQQDAIAQARHQPLPNPLRMQIFMPPLTNGAEIHHFGTQAWVNEPIDFSDVPDMIRKMNEDEMSR
jgi:hypothetical protein